MGTAKDTATRMGKPFFRYDPAATIVLLVLVFLLSQILAAILISFYPAMRDWTEAQSAAWLRDSIGAQFFYVLFAEVLAIGMVFQLVKKAHVTKGRIGLVAPKLRDIGYALIAYGLYFLSYIVIAVLVSNFIPSIDFEQEQQIGFDNAYGTVPLLMTFASLVILPPLAEEILFRGFLFTSLRAKYSFARSTVVTGILFGAAHLQFGADAPLLWAAAIDTFVLSCFLCYIREKTGSLWPAIFLHAIKNLLAFLVLFGTRF